MLDIHICLPDEHLAIVPGARIPPGAFEMVRDDALCDSYGRAADLLCRHTKTPLSRRSVGHILKESARIIQEQENRSACDIFINNGVAQDGQRVGELCVEADGTWASLQKEEASKVGAKTMCSYTNKATQGKRASRQNTVFFAGTLPSDTFWEKAMARLSLSYCPNHLQTLHLGAEGAGWHKAGRNYFPVETEVISHPDHWHLKRAAFAALGKDEAPWVWRLLEDGCTGSAIEAIDLCGQTGKVKALKTYVKNAEGTIEIPGPSMGTIEGDNSRYEDRLCRRRSWSLSGLSAITSLLSAKNSKMDMPLPGQYTKPARKRKHPVYSTKNTSVAAAAIVESVGSGYEPPSGHFHQKGTDDWNYIKWAFDGGIS